MAGSCLPLALPPTMKPNPTLSSRLIRFGLLTLLVLVSTAAAADPEVPPARHPRNESSEAEARKTIEAFFPLLNARDAQGALAIVHFPHIRMGGTGTVIIPTAKEWKGDPVPLESQWHHSALDSLEFIQSDANKVHAMVVFSRFTADGRRYASFPTLWIVTKVDGRWGIQVRSTFAP